MSIDKKAAQLLQGAQPRACKLGWWWPQVCQLRCAAGAAGCTPHTRCPSLPYSSLLLPLSSIAHRQVLELPATLIIDPVTGERRAWLLIGCLLPAYWMVTGWPGWDNSEGDEQARQRGRPANALTLLLRAAPGVSTAPALLPPRPRLQARPCGSALASSTPNGALCCAVLCCAAL